MITSYSILADKLGTSQTKLIESLSALTMGGLITKTLDRTKTEIFLTEKAEGLLLSAFQDQQTENQRTLLSLSAEQLRLLLLLKWNL